MEPRKKPGLLDTKYWLFNRDTHFREGILPLLTYLKHRDTKTHRENTLMAVNLPQPNVSPPENAALSRAY